MKRNIPPRALLTPLPAVLVTCGVYGRNANVLTVSWTGVVCTRPPCVSVSIRPTRLSWSLVRDNGEFVVNVPSRTMLEAVDFIGTHSGRSHDKFEETGLTQAQAEAVAAPVIVEASVNLECRVIHELELGTHSLFVGEVVATHVDESVVTSEGRLVVERLDPIMLAEGANAYHALGPHLSTTSFTRRQGNRS
jgi:flavin reductase (DIM6/NTAB) family NADH-FMN oxidoreductase RutF